MNIPRDASNGYYPRERREPMDPEEYDDGEHPDDEGGDANRTNNEVIGAEDAVLDLAELEQLQEEAERMKGLGNKHMAAQVSFIQDCSSG